MMTDALVYKFINKYSAECRIYLIAPLILLKHRIV